VPLYVATDQEGGYVQVLRGPGFSRIPTALTQGTWSARTVKARARTWGNQLRRAGVSLNLAPVMDTVSRSFAPSNRPIGYYEREFGHTPHRVLMKGTAFANGMRAAGLQVAIKHFPGLGRVRGNTDVSSGVTDRVTRRHSGSIRPFRVGVRAGAHFVMVGTAEYAKIDKGTPAAFSHTIVTGMLRHDLGFDGVVISDDLGQAKQVQQWSPGRRAVKFIRAGGDMVLTVRPSTVAPMAHALIRRAEHVPAFRSKVDHAALRVLRAKNQADLEATASSAWPRLVVDGVLGPHTTRATQHWLGVIVDGIWGPVTTRAFQRRVGSSPDGVIGPHTVAAAQRFLGIRRDGASRLDHRTVRALQRYLNAHR
jgi:beta-N-acetylhexosaminidase